MPENLCEIYMHQFFCTVDYGETKIKWKTTALGGSTQFDCGGVHKHVSGCIVGNFETKHKSSNHGQPTAFHQWWIQTGG